MGTCPCCRASSAPWPPWLTSEVASRPFQAGLACNSPNPCVGCPFTNMCTQVLEKLKEEAVGFDPHIRNLEETIKAKAAEHDAAIVANREAQHAKEVAKQVGASSVSIIEPGTA